jgi:hypothetical protein
MSWTRFLAVFDNHGDKANKSAVEKALKFSGTWKPQIRIHGGDNWNFVPLRRKATEDERHQSLKEDFEAGMHFLDRYKPTHFLRGNHDERLWELAERGQGIEADYALKGIAEIEAELKAIKCAMLPYHKRLGLLRLGHLKILHGFACGVYAARQTALVYGSTLFGHIHAIDEHAIPGLDRRVSRACGCLCELDMDYNARQPNTLRQAHGFAYGVVDMKAGNYHVWVAEEVGGKWVLPSDVVEL